MLLIIATILVTVAVATAAAFFSIYGLSQIFAGAFIAVVIMGAALEAGKLVATLLLHTYWQRMSFLLKSYLTAAVILLMIITSGGVYGFLSAAYQKEQIPLQQVNAKIQLLDSEYERKTERLAQMDKIIAEINPDYITKRLEEKKQQEAERGELTTRINAIEVEKSELVSRKIDTEAHIGPIIYIAEVFDKTSNDAANYLIMLLIVVFDPLAVALTISISSMLQYRKEDMEANEEEEHNRPQPIIEQPVVVQHEEVSYEASPPILVDGTKGDVIMIATDQFELTKAITEEEQPEEFVPIDIEDIVSRIKEEQQPPQQIDINELAELVASKMPTPERVIVEKPVVVEQEVEPEADERTALMRKVRENSLN